MGILAVAAIVVVPLVREYADFRRAWGLGRLSALGVTGLVVDSVDAAVAAVSRVLEFSRRRIRREFEKRFCAERMARDYLAVYEGLRNGRASYRHRPKRAEADDMARAI